MPGIVIVIVPLPIARRTAEKAIESARRTASTYTALADKGLIKKYYLNGEAGAAGVYLWQSEQAARAWYTPEWADRMQATHGVRPVVAYYDCHVTVDNETTRCAQLRLADIWSNIPAARAVDLRCGAKAS